MTGDYRVPLIYTVSCLYSAESRSNSAVSSWEGAEEKGQKNESAYQGRSRNARQGVELNSTWRRSLSGAAKHCFSSKDPCGSVWRFSEKQILDATQFASSSCDRSLRLATACLRSSSLSSRIVALPSQAVPPMVNLTLATAKARGRITWDMAAHVYLCTQLRSIPDCCTIDHFPPWRDETCSLLLSTEPAIG